MKIDNGASYLSAYRAQGTNSAARADGASSFAATLAGKTQETSNSTAGIKQADFTNMNRQEMRDWTNEQIRSGQITLEEGFPFMAMTMKISVADGAEVAVAGDHERIDFTAKARQGIEGALLRNDPEAAKRLQTAWDVLLKNQGQTIGVDVRV